MSLTKTVLRFAAPLPQVESFERYLFIGPHPDDIEIGAGATAAKLAAAGKKLTFLICTDGRFGTENTPGTAPEELIRLRKAESLASARAIGVDDVRFLELSDGAFYDPADLFRGIVRVIGEVKRFVKVKGLIGRQLGALLLHKTQFPRESESFRTISLYLKLRAADFGLRSLNGQAEGFRVLGRTQMHCLPEAGK